MSHIKSLRESIDKVVKHLKNQLSYQHEIKFVKQNNAKMKTAEREISRLQFAYRILKNAGVDVQPESQFDFIRDAKKVNGQVDTVLITKLFNDYKFEAWHPTLGEFDLAHWIPAPPKNNKFKQPEGPVPLIGDEKEEIVVEKPERYSEVEAILKIKSFAPLSFEAVLK